MNKSILCLLFFLIFAFNAFSQEQLLNMKSNLMVNSDIKQQNFQENDLPQKSAGLAILYSILLPGMGEYYAGDYSTGKYFTIADGIIWSAFAGITIYGNNKRDNYRAFAKSFGGVDLNNKDDEYFANIGIYENIDQFNRERELNREFNEVYNLETHSWYWSSTDQRKEYRSLWSSSESANNNLRFAVGALILNRVISAIFAVRAVSAYNKRVTGQYAWKMNFNLEQSATLPSKIVMNFSYPF